MYPCCRGLNSDGSEETTPRGKILSSIVQFSHSVVSNSLRPHEPQHTRPLCPSPTPVVHPNPCPLSRWRHPAISSSVVPFSSCPQSFSASGSFPMSQLFTSCVLCHFNVLKIQDSSCWKSPFKILLFLKLSLIAIINGLCLVIIFVFMNIKCYTLSFLEMSSFGLASLSYFCFYPYFGSFF